MTHQNSSGAAPPPAAALLAACEVRLSGPSGACRPCRYRLPPPGAASSGRWRPRRRDANSRSEQAPEGWTRPRTAEGRMAGGWPPRAEGSPCWEWRVDAVRAGPRGLPAGMPPPSASRSKRDRSRSAPSRGWSAAWRWASGRGSGPGSDRALRFGTGLRSKRRLRFGTGLGSDPPLRFGTGLGSDRPLRFGTGLRSDRPLRFGTGLGATGPCRFGTGPGERPAPPIRDWARERPG